MWHGEAIGRVLEAHGEESGPLRIAPLRESAARRQAMSTFGTIGSAAFAGRAFIALHMTWGAINEWTTQAGYGRLSESGGPPDAARVLRRIMKQEGSHIDFYATEAGRRLADSPRAQTDDPFALGHLWRPVGSGVMPKAEVGFMVRYLFEGAKGNAVAQRIDRRIDRLPGQGGLHLLESAVSGLSRRRARRLGKRIGARSLAVRQA